MRTGALGRGIKYIETLEGMLLLVFFQTSIEKGETAKAKRTPPKKTEARKKKVAGTLRRPLCELTGALI